MFACSGVFPIKCFHCGVTAPNLDYICDSLVIHAMESPTCSFVLNTRGSRYENDVAVIMDNNTQLRNGLKCKCTEGTD